MAGPDPYADMLSQYTAPAPAVVAPQTSEGQSDVYSQMLRQYTNSSAPETREPSQTPQMTGLARDVALPASNFAKGVAQSVDQFASSSTGDPLADTLLTYQGADLMAPANPLQFAAQKAGVINRPDLAPQNETERLIAAGSQGAGAALPMTFFGSPAVAIGSGIGGGVGSYEGAKALPNHPVIGSTVGGLVGGAAGGGIGSLAQHAANAAAGNLNEMGQAYQTAGVTPRLTGDVSNSPFLEKLQAYSMENPGSMGRTRAAAEATINDFGKSVADTASSLGPSASLDELGTNLQTQAKNWLNAFKANNQTVWGAVDAKLGGQPVDLSPVKSVLSGIENKAAGNDAAEAFLKSPLAKQIESITDAAQSGAVPWETAQALRSRVGEYLENPQLISDAGGTQAKQFYKAFSEAMENTANANPDPNAAALFAKANQYTSAGHDFIDSSLAPILRDGATPDKAAQFVLGRLNSGGTVAQNLRQNIPSAADDIAAYKLRDMALSTAGKQDAIGSAISPQSFLTDWNKLSPEAKSALYADPQVRDRVDALAKISEGIRSTARNLNTSHTQSAGAIHSMLRGGAGLAGLLAGHASGLGSVEGGAAGLALSEAAMPAMNYGASYLVANRPLARLLASQGPNTFRGQASLTGLGAALLGGSPNQIRIGP